MDWITDICKQDRDWLDELGYFGPTVHHENRELKGWIGGDAYYLTSVDLRQLAVACINAADWLDARFDTKNGAL